MTTRQRQQRVTDAHRRDLLNLLSFGALPFRAICVRYAEDVRYAEVTSKGRRTVDRGLVRRTLDSCLGRGEVMAVPTRRPGQHPFKHERAPMTVYALTDPTRLRHDDVKIAGRGRGLTEDERLLALLCVSADTANVGRTTLVCTSDEQARRVFDEAKRLLGSPAVWALP